MFSVLVFVGVVFILLGEEETPNEEGLKFYDEVISELEKHHMEPLITICHDEMPMHLSFKIRWVVKSFCY